MIESPRTSEVGEQRNGVYFLPLDEDYPPGYYPNYPQGVAHFDRSHYIENATIAREILALTRKVDLAYAHKMQRKWYPLATVDPRHVVQRIEQLKCAPSVRTTLGVKYPKFYSPENVGVVWGDYLDRCSERGGIHAPITSDHASDAWLLRAMARKGVDMQKIVWIVLDHHFDADTYDEAHYPEKATWINDALDLGIGCVHVLGNPHEIAAQITQGTIFNPHTGAEEDYAEFRRRHGFEVVGGDSLLTTIDNYRKVLNRNPNRLFLHSLPPVQGRYGSKITRTVLGKIMQDASYAGMKYVGISFDADVLDTYGQGVTATPYNHHDHAVRAGMSSLRQTYGAATFVGQNGKRMVDLDRAMLAMDALFDDDITISDGRRQLTFETSLGTGEGGFTVDEVCRIIDETRTFTSEHRMQFGIPLPRGGAIAGSIVEVEGLDFKGNTAKAIHRAMQAMTRV